MCDEKCNETADLYRDEGNAHFRNGEFQKALVCYNRSICYAVPGSRQLALGFANRSAVYMQVELFERCLENIRISMELGNCDKKLDEREKKCRSLMKLHSPEPSCDFFRLSRPANPKIPFIVDCLELREDAKFGRYIVTNTDLRPGEVIAIEEPFYKFIDKDVRYSRCCNCLKSNDLHLIPCTQCTSSEFLSRLHAY